MKKSYDIDELKMKLTKEQYDVLVNKGTERPFSGDLLDNKENGDYICPVCGTLVFKSFSKYDSDTPGLAGWPSFSDAVTENIEFVDDYDIGMHRIEVNCKTCGAHLGHLFDDPTSPTGKHYCINSAGLEFKPVKNKITK
jgi:peptide-methionine (R)-S-oxide reductase